MENNRRPNSPADAGLGPRPALVTRTGRPLSPSRAAILETLQAQPEPTTLAALVRTSGLHANTVREHLEALERQKLVTRHRAEPEGRGRPAWLYEAVPGGPGSSEYAGLAAALASAIQRTSSAPAEDARTAGAAWGHELAHDRGRPARTSAAARREVVALLDEVGFAPEADARHTVVRLTRCPLLEAAHKHPEVVCGVHLGLVSGALEEYGADPAGASLEPFAEPGACLLRMPPTRPREGR